VRVELAKVVLIRVNGGNNCVEVAAVPGGVALRDSKVPDRSLVAEPGAYRAFIAGVHSGGLADVG
jgi:hypothetical protein